MEKNKNNNNYNPKVMRFQNVTVFFWLKMGHIVHSCENISVRVHKCSLCADRSPTSHYQKPFLVWTHIRLFLQ